MLHCIFNEITMGRRMEASTLTPMSQRGIPRHSFTFLNIVTDITFLYYYVATRSLVLRTVHTTPDKRRNKSIENSQI